MLSQRLKALRKEQGLTLEDLSKLYNAYFGDDKCLNKGMLSKYENDKQRPYIETVYCLAEIFGVSLDYLVGRTEHRVQLVGEFITQPQDIPPSGVNYELYPTENTSLREVAVRIKTNNLAPLYHADEMILIRKNTIIESGQIGLFVLNGVGCLKILQGNRLTEYNPTHQEVVVGPQDDFIYVGKCVGKYVK